MSSFQDTSLESIPEDPLELPEEGGRVADASTRSESGIDVTGGSIMSLEFVEVPQFLLSPSTGVFRPVEAMEQLQLNETAITSTPVSTGRGGAKRKISHEYSTDEESTEDELCGKELEKEIRKVIQQLEGSVIDETGTSKALAADVLDVVKQPENAVSGKMEPSEVLETGTKPEEGILAEDNHPKDLVTDKKYPEKEELEVVQHPGELVPDTIQESIKAEPEQEVPSEDGILQEDLPGEAPLEGGEKGSGKEQQSELQQVLQYFKSSTFEEIFANKVAEEGKLVVVKHPEDALLDKMEPSEVLETEAKPEEEILAEDNQPEDLVTDKKDPEKEVLEDVKHPGNLVSDKVKPNEVPDGGQQPEISVSDKMEPSDVSVTEAKPEEGTLAVDNRPEDLDITNPVPEEDPEKEVLEVVQQPEESMSDKVEPNEVPDITEESIKAEPEEEVPSDDGILQEDLPGEAATEGGRPGYGKELQSELQQLIKFLKSSLLEEIGTNKVPVEEKLDVVKHPEDSVSDEIGANKVPKEEEEIPETIQEGIVAQPEKEILEEVVLPEDYVANVKVEYEVKLHLADEIDPEQHQQDEEVISPNATTAPPSTPIEGAETNKFCFDATEEEPANVPPIVVPTPDIDEECEDGAAAAAPNEPAADLLAQVRPPMSPQGRLSGTVKWYDPKNGFGYITIDNSGEDVFVHQRDIRRKNPRHSVPSLSDGERVEFVVKVYAAEVTGLCEQAVLGSPLVAIHPYHFKMVPRWPRWDSRNNRGGYHSSRLNRPGPQQPKPQQMQQPQQSQPPIAHQVPQQSTANVPARGRRNYNKKHRNRRNDLMTVDEQPPPAEPGNGI